eukprot:TRINITY_DN11291_c0_g2_i2.p1 TRINITY_DN11291_c0_g2~~TRINITY_DN11291_c0_g2_i2.p1  ORF type:complete len:278 (+),score=92.06 TRINITY_DN11291_c0_g2_i2:46-834(+)
MSDQLRAEVKRVISEMKEGGTLGQVMATLKKSEKLKDMNLDEKKAEIKKMIGEIQAESDSDSDSSSGSSSGSGSGSDSSSGSGSEEGSDDAATDATLSAKDFGEDEEQEEFSDQDRMSNDGADDENAIEVDGEDDDADEDAQKIKRAKTESETFTLARMTKFMKVAGIKLPKRAEGQDDEAYRASLQKLLEETHNVTSLDTSSVQKVIAKEALKEFTSLGIDPDAPIITRAGKKQALSRLKKKNTEVKPAHLVEEEEELAAF